MEKQDQTICPLAKKCGGCQLQGIEYKKQLEKKKVIKKENKLGKTKIGFRFKYSLLSCYRLIDRIVNDKKR